MKKEWAVVIGATVFTAVLVGLIVWMNVTVWHECRVNHSWLYCVRLVSK